MKRKVLRVGNASLAISLPKVWVNKNNLLPGMDIVCELQGKSLVITGQKTQHKKVEVDLTGLDRTTTVYLIQGLYRCGVHEVRLFFPIEPTRHYRTNKEVTYPEIISYVSSRLIGYELLEKNPDNALIVFFGKENMEDFDVIQRKLFYLFDDILSHLKKGFLGDKECFQAIELKHDEFTKFVSYCLRALVVKGTGSSAKDSLNHHIISVLDKMVDIIKYISRSAINYKKNASQTFLSVVENVIKVSHTYHKLFYSFKLADFAKINELRDETKQLLSHEECSSREEIIMGTQLTQLVELVLDLIESRMSLEYANRE